jgi:hypothetical protein
VGEGGEYRIGWLQANPRWFTPWAVKLFHHGQKKVIFQDLASSCQDLQDIAHQMKIGRATVYKILQIDTPSMSCYSWCY